MWTESGNENLKTANLSIIMVCQKQLENVEYFSCMGSPIRSDAKCTYEIKCHCKIGIQKEDSCHQQIWLKFREETNVCYRWSIDFIIVKLE